MNRTDSDKLKALRLSEQLGFSPSGTVEAWRLRRLAELELQQAIVGAILRNEITIEQAIAKARAAREPIRATIAGRTGGGKTYGALEIGGKTK